MPQLHKLVAIRAVHTSLDAETVNRRVIEVLTARKNGQIQMTDAGHVEGHCGSQVALQLKGGWIAHAEDFPIVAAVEFHPADEGGFQVRITVGDDLGFGLMFGMQTKYQGAIEELADELAEAVKAG
jgi:hypothetical protein